MAIIKREFILLASILSALATVLSVVSLTTTEWVTAKDTKWLPTNDTDTSQLAVIIKYGLFKGTLQTDFPLEGTVYEFDMTCIWSDNICAMMCDQDSDTEKRRLQQIYDGQFDKSDTACGSVQKTNLASKRLHASQPETVSPDDFINAGVWICTVLFVIISILFGVLSSAVSFYNFISNPYQVYLSILTVHIYNGVACGCAVLVLFLWGIMYAKVIYHNAGIFFTLTHFIESEGLSSLGYSFWLNIPSILLWGGSTAALLIRQHLVSKDPKQKMIERENTLDPEIFSF